MDLDQINIIKTKKRFPLTFVQTMRHYRFVIISMLIFCIFLYNSLTLDYTFFSGFYLAEIWFWVLLALLIFIQQNKKLSFKEFRREIEFSQLKEGMKRAINELDGYIETENNIYIQAFIKGPISGSDGDLLTAIKHGDTFMVNSIADPRKFFSFTFSGKRNKNNIKIYLKHLGDVLDNKPENIEYLIPEKEWTTKRIITRLILYPFFILIIYFSFKNLSEPIHFKSRMGGFFGLVTGFGYIIIDIILIIKRIKYNVQHKNKKH